MGDNTRSREGVSVELYVRSLAPRSGRSRQDAIVERLRAFDRRDVISSLDVVVTGDCLCPDSAGAETDPGKFLLDRVNAFQSWATAHDRSLEPFFVRRTRSTDLLGDPATGILFPEVTMAEFSNGELRFVTPCKEGDRMHTVRDRLAVLHEGDATLAEEREAGYDRAETRPDHSPAGD